MPSDKKNEPVQIDLPFHVEFLLHKWADYAAAAFAALFVVGLLQVADRVPPNVWIGLAAFALLRWAQSYATDAMIKKVLNEEPD